MKRASRIVFCLLFPVWLTFMGLTMYGTVRSIFVGDWVRLALAPFFWALAAFLIFIMVSLVRSD